MIELRLFWTFLKIGCTAFGGFMALIAVVQAVVVEKQKLISEDDLLEGISIASILPGPIAVNVVSYAGYKIRGMSGALAATAGVILPSFILMLILSHIYFTYQSSDILLSIFSGVLPAVVAIIVIVSIKLSKKNLNSGADHILAISAASILFFFEGFFITLSIIVISGLFGATLLYVRSDTNKENLLSKVSKRYLLQTVVCLFFFIGLLIYLLGDNQLTSLFFSFSKMSTTLFGGGYVFIPMMEDLIVNEKQWMTGKEFADCIAMGQITPGPILISATVIGYKVKGIIGAITASIGMFLPPALIIIVVSNYFDRIKQIDRIQAAIKSIKASVVGMIFIAAIIIGRSIEWDAAAIISLIISFILLYIYRLSILYVIPLAGMIGFVMKGLL